MVWGLDLVSFDLHSVLVNILIVTLLVAVLVRVSVSRGVVEFSGVVEFANMIPEPVTISEQPVRRRAGPPVRGQPNRLHVTAIVGSDEDAVT